MAVAVAVPAATAVTNPLDPKVLLIVATPVFDELHVTTVVMSWVVLSENVPVAVNWPVEPFDMTRLLGRIAIETTVADVTVNVVEAETPPDVTEIMEEPVAVDTALPIELAALLIVATPVFDELHVTDVVISRVALFENVPIAVNCWAVLTEILGFTGEMAIETSVIGVEPPPLPQPAIIATNRIRTKNLFDFIGSNPAWNQIRRISPPRQVSHMSPRFNHDVSG